MGDIVNFPDRYQKLQEKYKQAKDQGQKSLAIDLLKEIYQLKPTTNNHYQLAVELYQLEDHQECLEWIESRRPFYLIDLEASWLYFDCLLEVEDYEAANNLVDKEFSNHVQLEDLEDKLDRELQKRIDQLEDQKELLKDALFSLSHYEPLEQIELASQMPILDSGPLVRGSQLALINPQVNQVAKTALIDNLIKINYSKSLDLDLFDQTYQIKPSDLELFEKDSTLLKLQEKLMAKLANDPQSLDLLLKEVSYDIMILYPCHRKLITDLNLWLSYYLDYYAIESSGNDEPVLESDKKLYQLFKKVQDYKN